MRVEYNNFINQNQQPARKVDNQLGKEEFLKILIVQLQNQDPINPIEDKDFIAQMAQFSTLEQMQNMGKDFQFIKAMNLVGKEVYGEMNIENSSHIIPVLGRVDSVVSSEGKIYLRVGDTTLPLEDLVTVFADDAITNED